MVEEDVRLVEDGLLTLWIGDEVGRQVALVELHALDKIKIHTEGIGLLDGYYAVLAYLVDGIGNNLADRGIGRRDSSNVRNLFLRVIDPDRLIGD